MVIRIISNIRDGKGLARDADVCARVLRDMGREVEVLDFRDPAGTPRELSISFEVVAQQHLGRRNWIFPNPEWWMPVYTPHLHRFEKVLCKTRDAVRLFEPIAAPGACELVGFMSEDRRDESVPRSPEFFHAVGGSQVKGTPAILAAWARYAIPYPLTIAGRVQFTDVRGAQIHVPNVTFSGWLDDATYKRQQNRHRFHLCPSMYEGWGHHLHEALGVGAIVVSTLAPPMEEFEAAIRMPATPGEMLRLAVLHHVAPPAIRDAVERCVAMSDADVTAASRKARLAYVSEVATFKAQMRRLVESV